MLKKIRKLWYAFLLNYHPTVKAWVFLFEDLSEQVDQTEHELFTCPIVMNQYGIRVKKRYRQVMDIWFDHYFNIHTSGVTVPFHRVVANGKTSETAVELRKRFLREMVQKFKTMEKFQ